MARVDGRRENQHYVPKILLRNFISNGDANRGSEKIWVFDKSNSKISNPNIKNIAAQFSFYDTNVDGKAISVESILAELENCVSAVLSKLIEHRSATILSQEERTWFAIFCAAQFVRVENFRSQVKDMNAALKDKLQALGHDTDSVDGHKFLHGDDSEIKKFSISFLMSSLRQFSAHFLQKHWFVMCAPEGQSFYLGDNPISLHNNNDFGPYGNIGLAVPGIEIYFPISSKLTVAMWDPANVVMFENGLSNAQGTLTQADSNTDLEQREKLRSAAARVIERVPALLRQIKGECPYVADNQEVMFVNSLQVMYASRFVMSCANGFSLVEKMISDNEKYRSSIKMKIG